MNRSRLVILSILLSIASLPTDTAVATRYYVDSQGGNDRNNGLEAATAWKSHTKVRETKLRPGDVIMFKLTGNALPKIGAWDIGAFSYVGIDSSVGGLNHKPSTTSDQDR